MVLIVAREDADTALAALQQNGETAWRIGQIAARQGQEAQISV
jgi:phosphoribosylaminoimidazole (AIR) synthetase